jgi:homocysteine S-methyltransferase
MSTNAPHESDLMILDGGLATELERRGHDLNHPLWSARVLLTEPETIREVHEAYLEAGADIITTSTYQATLQGLEGMGLSTAEAFEVLELSINLALQAKSRFQSDEWQPLVAASIGPYGAYCADGSEYTGQYDRNEDQLLEFHQDRFEILAGSEVDLLACETIPSLPEARALARLIREHPDNNAWVSFTCRDAKHICDGTPIANCARTLDHIPNIIALGVNCTPPHLIPDLIAELKSATSKPIIVYPNSGETFDPRTREWLGEADPSSYAHAAQSWIKAGASIVGGCCRTTPTHIQQLSQSLTQ